VSVSYDIDQEHGIFRIDDSPVAVDPRSTGLKGHDRAEDEWSTTPSDPTGAAFPLWKQAPVYGREKHEIARNGKSDVISGVLSSNSFPTTLTELVNVEEVMLDAIDNGLLALGEIVRDTIYDRFDRMYQLRREDIPKKLDTFHEALQTMFGAGAKVIETQIVKNLDRKLNVGITENENWTIVDYFDLWKRIRR
jgi:hypothetical protein